MRIASVFLIVSACFALVRPMSAQSTPDYQALADKIGSLVAWIDDGHVLKDNQIKSAARPRSRPTATSQPIVTAERKALNEAFERAEKERRLVLWYVDRVDGSHMYREALLDEYARCVYWTDPQIARIVAARFVPLRAKATKEIGEEFGIVFPDVVEPAIVFLTPERKVVHITERIRTFNAAWLRRLLVAVLDANPEWSIPELDLGKPELPLAMDALDIGAWSAADAHSVAAAGVPETAAKARLLRARLCRNRGDIAGAQAELGELREIPRHGLDAEAAFEGLMTTVYEGTTTDVTIDGLEKVSFGLKGTESGDEARYVAGLSCILARRTERGLAMWQSLCTERPDSPYAWKAAIAFLVGKDTTPRGPQRHNYEDLGFRASALVSGLAGTTHGLLSSSSIRHRAHSGLRWLLDHQSEDGGWNDSRYAFWDTPKIVPNVRVAVSALAASALLEWRHLDPEAVDAALEKADAYLRDDSRLATGANEECYAEAYRLLYLSKRLEHTSDNTAKLEVLRRIDGVVNHLIALQNDRGFFSHEYANPFTTAAVMQCLQIAKAAGANIPADMIAKGAKALESVRDPATGTFSYGAPADGGKAGISSPKDAMARMPVCEEALLRAGRSDEARLGAAFDNFLSHLDRFEKIRKCDFHSDGELGGFFFWHAFFHATEASKALTSEKAGQGHSKFLSHLLEIQEFDGSFIDSHELGKSYGTAMGLLSLDNLSVEE